MIENLKSAKSGNDNKPSSPAINNALVTRKAAAVEDTNYKSSISSCFSLCIKGLKRSINNDTNKVLSLAPTESTPENKILGMLIYMLIYICIYAYIYAYIYIYTYIYLCKMYIIRTYMNVYTYFIGVKRQTVAKSTILQYEKDIAMFQTMKNKFQGIYVSV